MTRARSLHETMLYVLLTEDLQLDSVSQGAFVF